MTAETVIDNDQQYRTINEVADYLRVSPATVRKWVGKGQIPVGCYIHIEGTYRFHLERLEKALLNKKDDE